ncbi:hypothetical protein GJ496_002174 [Pomphorhynchus laevis]|nr:hypothetical protein GJ496_002174 [Pomphorhynchus laevis]
MSNHEGDLRSNNDHPPPSSQISPRRRRHNQISNADDDTVVPRRRRRMTSPDHNRQQNRNLPCDRNYYPARQEQNATEHQRYRRTQNTNAERCVQQGSHNTQVELEQQPISYTESIYNDRNTGRRRRRISSSDHIQSTHQNPRNIQTYCEGHASQQFDCRFPDNEYEVPRRRRRLRSPDPVIAENSVNSVIRNNNQQELLNNAILPPESFEPSPHVNYHNESQSRGIQCIPNTQYTLCSNQIQQMHPFNEQQHHHILQPQPLPVIYRMSHYLIETPTPPLPPSLPVVQNHSSSTDQHIVPRRDYVCDFRGGHSPRSQRGPIQISSYIMNPANHCMSRRFRRQLRRQMISISENYNSRDTSSDNGKGLSPSEINSIPIIEYEDTWDRNCDAANEDDICKICLIKFENKHQVKKLSKCGHVFHAICLNEWLREHHKCPYCRQALNEYNCANERQFEHANIVNFN